MRMHLYPQMRIFRIWGYSANADFTQIRTFRIYTSAIVSVSRIKNVKLRLESNWAGLANGGFRLLARGNDNDQWIKNISRGNLHQPAKQIIGVREVPNQPRLAWDLWQKQCARSGRYWDGDTDFAWRHVTVPERNRHATVTQRHLWCTPLVVLRVLSFMI